MILAPRPRRSDFATLPFLFEKASHTFSLFQATESSVRASPTGCCFSDSCQQADRNLLNLSVRCQFFIHPTHLQMQAFCSFFALLLAFIIPYFYRLVSVYRMIGIIQFIINNITVIKFALSIFLSHFFPIPTWFCLLKF